MNYYVQWPDGQKFGPADEATLAQWKAEGRITSETDLENAATGDKLKYSDIEELGVSWSEAAPVPSETSDSDRLAMEAQALDQPAEETHFEIPQEFPTSSSSPYPVESYYKKGKSDLSTAWTLICVGFVLFLLPCCTLFTLGGISMVGVGIYYADKALKTGEDGAKTAKTVGIVALVIQILLIMAYFAFLFFAFAGGMGGRSIFRP